MPDLSNYPWPAHIVNCPACKAWYVGGAFLLWNRPGYEDIYKKWLDHSLTHGKTHKGNGAPQGAFAFTLTMSPADELTAGDLLVAVRKLMSQKSNPVKRYAWNYEEKGKDASGNPLHPHIHGIYETESGGRIHAKHFQRVWKIWDEKKPMGQGFRGGYHRLVKSEEDYADYIAKEGMLGENKNVG